MLPGSHDRRRKGGSIHEVTRPRFVGAQPIDLHNDHQQLRPGIGRSLLNPDLPEAEVKRLALDNRYAFSRRIIATFHRWIQPANYAGWARYTSRKAISIGDEAQSAFTAAAANINRGDRNWQWVPHSAQSSQELVRAGLLPDSITIADLRQTRLLPLLNVALLFIFALALTELIHNQGTDRRSIRTSFTDPIKRSRLLLDSIAVQPVQKDSYSHVVPQTEAQVTAILLNWTRLDNLRAIVAHLCTHAFFKEIWIWNNNPKIHLQRDMFVCPRSSYIPNSRSTPHIILHNSPRNLYFMPRYTLCAAAQTPYCYFQDDDWLPPTLQSFYQAFLSTNGTEVWTDTNDWVYALSQWEWCFFNSAFDLHTCFSWVGTGALVPKDTVLRFLHLMSMQHVRVPDAWELGREHHPFLLDLGPGVNPAVLKTAGITNQIKPDEMALADMYFTTFLNRPVHQLQNRLLAMDQLEAFSSGTGRQRNKLYMHIALKRLFASLSTLGNSSPFLDSDAIDSNTLKPSTYDSSHDIRAPCMNDKCLFLTNVQSFPNPDHEDFEYHPSADIEYWEELHYMVWGNTDSGEGVEGWTVKWPYWAAVDGDTLTAWRSHSLVKKGEYIGLDLLLRPSEYHFESIEMTVILEHGIFVQEALLLEVSQNRQEWFRPFEAAEDEPTESQNLAGLTCRLTDGETLSSIPFPALPEIQLHMLTDRIEARDSYSRKWANAARGGIVSRCTVRLSTAGEWRYIRIIATQNLDVPWGVYEMYHRGSIKV